MKVAFVYPHAVIPVPPVGLSDSLAIVMHELSSRLATTCDVFVYSKRIRGQSRVAVHEGVTYRRVRVLPDRLLGSLELLRFARRRIPRWPFRMTRLYYPKFAREVARDIRARNCDVIHVISVTSLLPVLRRMNPRARIVLHSEDHALADFASNRLTRRLADADLVLGCSNFVTNNIRTRLPRLEAGVKTLYNGVRADGNTAGHLPSARSPGADTMKILYVGRISPEKGVHVLLDAMRSVWRRDPNVLLQIAGPHAIAPKEYVDPFDEDFLLRPLRGFYHSPGSYAERLNRQLNSDKADRVRYLGAIPNSELSILYARSDVLVVPSVWHEPFGIPVIEGMAAGLPVIATRGGAFPEIVADGTTGLLVGRGDADQLAKAICRLIDNPQQRQSMGKAARERAQNTFSWDIIADQLLSYYRSMEGKD